MLVLSLGLTVRWGAQLCVTLRTSERTTPFFSLCAAFSCAVQFTEYH